MSKLLITNKKDQGYFYKIFFDYSFKRNLWEALAGYILQVLGMYVVMLVSSKLLSSFSVQDEIVDINIRFILIAIVIIYVAWIEVSILQEKKLLQNKSYILTVVVFALLTYSFGGLVGLLPVIYFSMRDSNTGKSLHLQKFPI